MGSAAGGLLFDVASLPDAPFLLMTMLVVLGVLLSLGLPNMLVHGNLANPPTMLKSLLERDNAQKR